MFYFFRIWFYVIILLHFNETGKNSLKSFWVGLSQQFLTFVGLFFQVLTRSLRKVDIPKEQSRVSSAPENLDSQRMSKIHSHL